MIIIILKNINLNNNVKKNTQAHSLISPKNFTQFIFRSMSCAHKSKAYIIYLKVDDIHNKVVSNVHYVYDDKFLYI